MPDTEACAGVGVHTRGEEIVSPDLPEGKCGAACVKLLTLVPKGPPGPLMSAYNASISVLALSTSVKGV